jgi:hypothetical protein
MVEALVVETLVHISIRHSNLFIRSICKGNIFNFFAVSYQQNSIFLCLECDVVRLSKGNLILRNTQVVDIRAACAQVNGEVHDIRGDSDMLSHTFSLVFANVMHMGFLPDILLGLLVERMDYVRHVMV